MCDSYTIGESVNASERWPVQLVERVNNSQDRFVMTTPTIIAQTGWTAQELRSAIDEKHPGSDFDLVSLLIGVNNQYRDYPIEDYPKEFESLLNMAIEFARGSAKNVIVLSIPDYGYTPFGNPKKDRISAGIKAYNEINKRITDEKGVNYYNITDISKQGLEKPMLIAKDGLHPSGKQYSLWIEQVIRDEGFWKIFK
ncbi:SGNH/GDSL hydrolase family protein [Fulvivirga sp. M361]|uniref:SGNH/GDSL hydrolase family protein n=1 Tax=Fulvivirga sp. M361 TaxID=2594266 RepID=UPI0021029560|nr:SGNH/GDSL hydrolase family protein [Fulvivirga sp. M361]